jgi:hypothetical protein
MLSGTLQTALSCGHRRYAAPIWNGWPTPTAIATLLAVAGLALMPAPAPAPVPPKDCGFLTVKNKRLNVKADQLRCAPARKYTRRYMKGDKPRGFACTDYGSETAIEFRCSKGAKVFFAIRR